MFKLYCDRCGRFLRDVTFQQAKEAVHTDSTICKECTKAEEKLINLAERMKRVWDSRVNDLIAEAKKELHQELKRIIANE